MELTVHAIFFGLMALFPSPDGQTRNVLLVKEQAATGHACHRPSLEVVGKTCMVCQVESMESCEASDGCEASDDFRGRGKCGPCPIDINTCIECPIREPPEDALTVLHLDPLAADTVKLTAEFLDGETWTSVPLGRPTGQQIRTDKLDGVWPLSQHLCAKNYEEAAVLTSMPLADGALDTCSYAGSEARRGSAPIGFFLSYSDHPTINTSCRISPTRPRQVNQFQKLAEVIAWNRTISKDSGDSARLRIDTWSGGTQTAYIIEPTGCDDDNHPYVAILLGNDYYPDVNNNHCPEEGLLKKAKHFAHYYPLFDARSARYPMVPAVANPEEPKPFECGLPRGIQKLIEVQTLGPAVPSDKISCPIVQ